MNYARFQAIHSGLTSAAKKVYEAVPIAAPWSTAQIVTELHRCGSSMDFRIAAGCIKALIDAGLVIEKSKDQFYRTPVRPRTEAAPPVETTPFNPPRITAKAPVKTETTAPGPIDKLTKLSARVTAIRDELQALASDIDTAALEIEEQIQAAAAGDAKLRQLQTLLREVV